MWTGEIQIDVEIIPPNASRHSLLLLIEDESDGGEELAQLRLRYLDYVVGGCHGRFFLVFHGCHRIQFYGDKSD